nr:gustatory receptor 8 [Pieris rapae]
MFNFNNNFSIKLLLGFRLLLGQYCEFKTSKIIRVLLMFYCFVFHILMCLVIQTFFDSIKLIELLWYIKLLKILVPVKVITNLCLSLFYKEKYFLIFYKNLETIDIFLKYNKKFDACLTIGIFSVIIFGQLIFEIVIFYPMDIMYGLEKIVDLVLFLNLIIPYLIYEMYWQRMKYLRLFLQSKCVLSDDVNIKIFHLKKFVQIYKHLLDQVGKANRAIKVKMFFDIIFSFLKGLIDISVGIKYLIQLDSYQHFHIVTLILLPILNLSFYLNGVIFLDLVYDEYENIKASLVMEQVKCEDNKLHEEIVIALEYLEIRPPRYSVWRIFPLNFNLITAFVNNSVTYIVVLLSFKFSSK